MSSFISKLFFVVSLSQISLLAFGQFNTKYASQIELKEVSSTVCNTKVLEKNEVKVEFVINLESANDEHVTLVETWIFPRELSDGKSNYFKVVESKSEKPTNENIKLSYSIIESYENVKGTWRFKLHHKNKLILEREFLIN